MHQAGFDFPSDIRRGNINTRGCEPPPGGHVCRIKREHVRKVRVYDGDRSVFASRSQASDRVTITFHVYERY